MSGPGKGARFALGGGADISQILGALDQGTFMVRFFRRRSTKPEKRIFCLKTDTFEILQYPMQRGRLTLSEESSKILSNAQGG
jgi:hypothetical protein